MKIDCRMLAELLFDYVSGDLTDERLALLEAHLRACPPCVVQVETYRLTIRLTRCLAPVPLPAEAVQRMRAAVDRECPGRLGQST